MSANGLNMTEDGELAEYEGESVVTMLDVLQEQQEFEDDANAVLGASDEKNCTYSKGYIKRQAIYACLTCCSEARIDPEQRAGVCLACSLNCHENHELIELYTKRNFRCDCGNPKFNHPCQFTAGKTELNTENSYNQNFCGLYCVCNRPYPDPEAKFEDEMIQCIVCEDWLHASHLEATVPDNDQYSEMICKMCMEKNEFLHDYSELVVNIEDRNVEVVNGHVLNGRTEIIEDEVEHVTMDKNEEYKENLNISCNENNSSVIENNDTGNEVEKDESVLNKEIDKLESAVNNVADINVTENISQPDEINTLNQENETEESLLSVEIEQQEDKQPETNVSVEDSITEDLNKSKPENVLIDSELNTSKNNEVDTTNANMIDDTSEYAESENLVNEFATKDINQSDPGNEIKESELTKETNDSNEVDTASTKMSDDSSENAELENLVNESDTKIEEINSTVTKTSDQNKTSDIDTLKETEKETSLKHSGVGLSNESSEDQLGSMISEDKQECNIADDSQNPIVANNIQNTSVSDEKQESTNDKEELMVAKDNDEFSLAEEQEPITVESKQPSAATGDTQETDNMPIKPDNTNEMECDTLESATEELSKLASDDNETNDNLKTEPEHGNQDTSKDVSEIEMNDERSKHMENSHSMDNTEDTTHLEKEKPTDQPDNKRKLEETPESSAKKPKLDECTRPKSKRVYKGATFWPAHFRQRLCTCSECLTMYKDLSVMFLIDPEDTVMAYQTLGKERIDGSCVSQYEKGLEALSSLDRIQQINALTEYNNMRDRLLDFLKSFKERKEIVKEEDIKAFFAGMKPRREPDGVYFCR